MDDRIKKLEQAIRDANSWLKAGEGVSLTYYYDEGYKDVESVDLIREVLGENHVWKSENEISGQCSASQHQKRPAESSDEQR